MRIHSGTSPACALGREPRLPPWVLLGLAAVALCGCTSLQTANVEQWSPDQAVLARAEFDGPQVTIHNIRNCQYRSADDYTVRYYDKTFDLGRLDSTYFILVPFPGSAALAHTMLSFGFADRDYIGVSAEVRRKKGENYSALAGLLGHYPMTYVVGDERDLIGLRANVRDNEVYLYRMRLTAEQSRRLFLDMMRRVNQLAEKPELYNTLSNNCTTVIRQHVNRVIPNKMPYDYRLLLPGYADRLVYDVGLLDTDLSFEETKRRASITRQAYLYRDGPGFSQGIRR
jgi:hypothetical protein